ncbi:hypothetical protein GOQ29_14420 [Clostridium sp. D2Q-14]|uniref:hypothetical protein n=1 Tax=Anaeromonas gelatinilytica TaxID=2683194 RepID=UPI00193C3DB5|nr:hypothetical protein [Anaeromonas gelatinilytica]MBS4536812.1 hypothetical protein [Anaeromonas gelatinilytica]
MTDLEKLKDMINEYNYPYFDDAYLQEKINSLEISQTLNSLARELCITKSGIEEIKLGDITIPSPKNHFLTLASKYRTNLTGVVTRADEY